MNVYKEELIYLKQRKTKTKNHMFQDRADNREQKLRVLFQNKCWDLWLVGFSSRHMASMFLWYGGIGDILYYGVHALRATSIYTLT